ncbi:IclR family transcriptional regulator C-terminal domain-containing protein [Streptomyces clavifer]|uniref:IclR family transcriptional regulator domain-containing protein n=1 Tax=Streptomyces TaxID=1883 RepID=UPI0006F496B7|nr:MULTISPECIES: IclR family transcriptional regulator C-terminal domain-containing protein [unclassified Streptomyces]KQX88361.1 IclR family transcriptional regulator [Streptomyces sp. Root1319]KQZ16136.1 IclR family transcriptional regulator [Streptomyces sp. Root55]
MPDTRPPEAVGPLVRGVAVLREISDAGGGASLGELVRATGLARSTVDRVVATLARMGYVRLDGNGARAAPRLMELGNAYLAAVRLPALLGPSAERLAEELDESVSLAVPDGDGIRFVHQTTRRRAMSLSFRIGDLLPAESTAPGPLFAAAGWSVRDWQAWRAHRAAAPAEGRSPYAVPPRSADGDTSSFEARAARAAKDGWSVDDQNIEPGLVAVAVPVRDPRGEVVCALSVVSHTSRHGADSLRRTVLPRARAAATGMERELGGAAPAAPARAPGGLAQWTTASKQELGAEFVESLARGLTVVTAFGEGREELTLAAVAETTGLARATARRALITLEHLGCVTSRDRFFRLTPRVLGLGHAPLSRTTLPEIALPHMGRLVGRLHDSASLAVLDGDDIRYTARVATERVMSVNITTGTRFPAHATSMGRVLLAGLPRDERAERLGRTALRALTPHTLTDPAELAAVLDQVDREGHALADGELEEGLRSLAVPVRDVTGAPVAALNVAMHVSRRTVAACLREVLPELRAAAALIESDLHVVGRFGRVSDS